MTTAMDSSVRREFLDALAAGQSRALAAQSVGLSADDVARTLWTDADLARQVEAAEQMASDAVRAAIHKAALTGSVAAQKLWLEAGRAPAAAVDEPPEEDLTPAQVERRLGLTTKALRQMAASGDLVPSWHTEGGHRRYSARDVVAYERYRAGLDDADDATDTGGFEGWRAGYETAQEARAAAQAADSYWRARQREHQQRLAEGEVFPREMVQAMIAAVDVAIDSVMGDSLAMAWAGGSVSRDQIQEVMDVLKAEIESRWLVAGVPI